MGPYTLFISDLHLDAAAPDRTASFFRFLDNQGRCADALYILGDFFDIWIGDDEQQEFHKDVIKKLKEYSKKIPVFFMHGNHDFFIGNRFTKETGCQLIDDPTTIELYGEKIILAHGDGLITDDKKHMRYRKLYQIQILKKLFLLFPLFIRKYVAKFAKDNSRSHLNPNKLYTYGVNDKCVKDLLAKESSRYLIHGHMHLPNVHTVKLNDDDAKRIVLDAWFRFGNYLRWEKEGEKSIQWFHHKDHATATRDC